MHIILPICISGIENFKGSIVHTHDYRSHVGYENKKVVVVGIGNSGGDVAVELSRVASQVRYPAVLAQCLGSRTPDHKIASSTLVSAMLFVGDRLTHP